MLIFPKIYPPKGLDKYAALNNDKDKRYECLILFVGKKTLDRMGTRSANIEKSIQSIMVDDAEISILFVSFFILELIGLAAY